MDFFKKLRAMAFVCLLYWRTGFSISVVCAGVLQVDAGPIVLMGSDLNVLCRSEEERCGRHFSVYLNQLPQTPLKVLNCSTVMLHLTDIRTPTLELKCIVSEDGHKRTVCGKNFRSGYPPDKSTNFKCFGPRDSENIRCIWEKGKETHIPTSYNVTFKNSENRTYTFCNWNLDAAELHIPWSVFGDGGECTVDVTARNGLGESASDTFLLSAKDVEMPSSPKIISVDFKNNSAVLRWQSSEPSAMLGKVRLGVTRGGMTSWEDRNGSDSSTGELILDGLQPQTQYEFQIQSCTQGERPKCSLWSPAVQRTSPGIAPSRKLDVWRIFESAQDDRVRNVTVLWKPLAYEEYSGVMVCYQLVYEQHRQKTTVSCAANVTECTVQLPHGVNTLLVTAVTSAGNSPPSLLSLRQTGLPGPRVLRLTPAGNDSVFVTWALHADQSEWTVCHVAQWQSTSLDLHWKRLPAERNSTRIEGLKPGIRFNVSLYSVTSSGSSYPVSALVYSKEEPPLSGPKVSIGAVEESRILIRWEELDLHQQRGFITNYTVHMRKCKSGQRFQKETLEGPQAGQRWLAKPAASFILHVSASNSAGEGPEGEGVPCQCHTQPGHLQDSPEGDFSIKVCLAVTIPLFILANLMYWKCFRRRVKMTCINLGPQWLFEKFPKVENSSVTKMLQENYSYSSWSSVYTDPPITPVQDIPKPDQTSLHSTVSREHCSDKGDDETTLQAKVVLYQDSGYKPQITPFAPEEDILESEDSLVTGDLICEMETPKFQRHWPWGVSEDRHSPGLRTRIRPILNPSDERALAPRQDNLLDFNSFLEETRYGQTLLPDDLVSCLMGLRLKPAESTSYFSQGAFGTENHS